MLAANIKTLQEWITHNPLPHWEVSNRFLKLPEIFVYQQPHCKILTQNSELFSHAIRFQNKEVKVNSL